MFSIHFWVVAPCVFSGNSELVLFLIQSTFLQKIIVVVLLLRLAQIFFSSLSKLQKNCQSDRMRFQKLLPNNLAGVLNEKSNFSLVEYVDISRSLPNYRLPAKLLFKPKRKKFASKLCDFNNLTGQNNLFQLIIFHFIFCFIHSGALGLKLFDWSNA